MHGVREAFSLAYTEYQMELLTKSKGDIKKVAATEIVKLAETTTQNTEVKSFWDFLLGKEYINGEEGIVQIEKLLGSKMALGNGSNNKDVYKVEREEKEENDNYKVIYYDKISNTITIWSQEQVQKEPSNPSEGEGDAPEPVWELVETISSPNYPQAYPEYCNKSYSQTFDENVVGVKIEFKKINLEMDEFCRFDNITIYNKNRELLYLFCGKGAPAIIILGNYYELLFTTDSANSYEGFCADIYITKSKALVGDSQGTNVGKTRCFNHIEESTEEAEIEFSSSVQEMDINIFNSAWKEIGGENTLNKEIPTDIICKIFNENGELIYTQNDFKCDYEIKKDIHLENVGRKMKVIYERSSDSTIKSRAMIYLKDQ